MASQIAHIIYAQKYFESFELAKIGEENRLDRFPRFNEKTGQDEFILGCVFPDIRRIDPSIKRKDTHLHFSKLDLDFRALSSFEAGWKFHLYCDMRREDILNKYKFYSIRHSTDFFGLPAKMLEDELVYEKYRNWEKLNNFFNNPPFPNIDIEITPETFHLWYAILARYIQEKPSDKEKRIFLSKQPNLSEAIDTIIQSVAKLRENKKAIEILQKVTDEIV
jgi:hypothetical protein